MMIPRQGKVLMDEHLIILRFRDFISKNWKTVSEAEDITETLVQDWLQANWELLVERQLLDSNLPLLFYGEGAENGKSSRYTFLDAVAKHVVHCKPKSGDMVFDHLNNLNLEGRVNNLEFDRFVTMRPNGWYYEEPPFDKVLCYVDGKEVIFDVNDLKFKVGLYSDPVGETE